MATGLEAAVTQQATQMAQQAGGGILSFLSNIVTAPVTLLGNIGRGLFSGVMSGGLIGGALGLGTVLVAPGLIRPVLSLVGLERYADRLSDTNPETRMSTTEVLAAGAGTGVAIAAGVGALSGVARSFTGNGVGGFIGTAATTVAIGALIMGSMNRDGSIQRDASGDNEVTPPPAPRRPSGNTGNTTPDIRVS